MPALERLYTRHRARGFVLLAVSVDSDASLLQVVGSATAIAPPPPPTATPSPTSAAPGSPYVPKNILLLVGTPTYGKAVVQTIDPLGDGGALALTIARYFTPAGVDISRMGVVPDIRAEDRPGPTDDVLAVGLAALAARAHH